MKDRFSKPPLLLVFAIDPFCLGIKAGLVKYFPNAN